MSVIMHTKLVPPILFIGVQEEIRQSEIPAFAERAVAPLYEALTGAGAELAGDLHFMCPSFRGFDEPSLIQIAVPVVSAPHLPAPLESWRSPEFHCARHDHRGPTSMTQAGWGHFVDSIVTTEAPPGPGLREIYKHRAPSHSHANLTKLQRELFPHFSSQKH